MMKAGLYCLLVLVACSCKASSEAVSLSKFKELESEKSFLMLTFHLESKEKGENIKLQKIQGAKGQLKTVQTKASSNTYLKTVIHSPYETYVLENNHPLYSSVEIFSEDGSISKITQFQPEGTLFLRFPYNTHLKKLEIFQNKVDQPENKVYTLKFKR